MKDGRENYLRYDKEMETYSCAFLALELGPANAINLTAHHATNGVVAQLR